MSCVTARVTGEYFAIDSKWENQGQSSSEWDFHGDSGNDACAKSPVPPNALSDPNALWVWHRPGPDPPRKDLHSLQLATAMGPPNDANPLANSPRATVCPARRDVYG